VYYRNLEHLVYKLSGLVDPFRGQDIEEVCRLAAKGLAQTEIAARVGMTEDAVDSILDRYEGRKVPAMRPLRCGAQAKRAEEKRTQKRKELLKVAEKVNSPSGERFYPRRDLSDNERALSRSLP
jgi:hypothetical protein